MPLRDKHVESLSCGYEHSLALTSSGHIYTWGQGEGGLLGHGNVETQVVPKKVAFFKKIKVSKAVTGALHNLAITQDGAMYSWGRAEGGQLGLPKDKLE